MQTLYQMFTKEAEDPRAQGAPTPTHLNLPAPTAGSYLEHSFLRYVASET